MNKIKTPCFVINKKELLKNIEDFRKALEKNWGSSRIGYSFKTNSLPWVLKFVLDNKCYAEVVSSDEYELALHIGYKKSQIIFNGPVKGKAEFIDALLGDAIVNIDSRREIDWIKEFSKENSTRIKIGVRVNIDLEKECPKEVGYSEDGTRFGFNLENGDLYRVLEELKSIPSVSIEGLHLHTTSKTRSLNIYRELSKKACEIKKRAKIDFAYIDIGGGFFGGLPDKPSLDDYVRTIKDELVKEYSPDRTCLIVEPGSAIIASPISFICDVIDVKDTNKSRIVTTNASRTNIDPLMIKTKHFYKHIGVSKKIIEKQVIGGFTCMDVDRLMVLYDENEFMEKDIIIFEKVGSYTMSLNPLFIDYFPYVYVYDGESYECVRKKWGVKEYMQNNCF